MQSGLRMNRAISLIFWALLLVAMTVSRPVAAADVLVLVNGDRITGEISAVWDDEITIEPSYSDEFNVDAEVWLPTSSRIESSKSNCTTAETSWQDPSGGDAEGNQVLEVGRANRS